MPYFILMLTFLSGHDATIEILGILIGHIYFYANCVVPIIPETEDVKVIKSPQFLINLCQRLHIHDFRQQAEAQ